MIKNKINISLFSVFLLQLSLPSPSLAMQEDNDGNKNPTKQLLRDPSDFYHEEAAEKERDELYKRVWKRAKEAKKRIKFLEAEIVKEVKKPGEIPAEYPDEASFTFRYHNLTKELEDLREEQMETNQHFGGVNPPTSDDEEEINEENNYREEIRERALRKGLLIPNDVDPIEVESQINTYDPSQEELEAKKERQRELYGDSDSE